MRTLAAREGYRLWAEHYDAETAVSHLENGVVGELGVPTAGRTLLDVGCGTGRRLRSSSAAFQVGADLTLEMLAHRGPGADPLVAADLRALPFAAESWNVVWCRLVLGHVRELDLAYAALARVCRAGGMVVVSDLSPEAIAAGHRRTFRDGHGTVRQLEHFVHTPAMHSAAADRWLDLVSVRDGVVGPAIREYYTSADRADAYDAQLGLPLVRAFAWRKRVVER